MVSRIRTVAFSGLDVTEVDVQVQMSSGTPVFTIVGLPDKAVGESRERVRAAISALGLSLPAKRITVNLSPADIAKEGSHYDLPIALGLLVGMGVIPEDAIQNYLVLGELALDGQVLPVSGVLPAAIGAQNREQGLICPAATGSEARWAGDFPILAPESLLSLINHFKGNQILPPQPLAVQADNDNYRDLREVRGQETARRALEIAAAGGHNLLMVGPPGSGKSLLASCLPGILPPPTPAEILETSMIASIAGKIVAGKLSSARPFRDPHHSASMPAMVGGGKRPMPGEISLAHNGVLFLDELPEFPKVVLESLRQPMETGQVSIARANSHVTYPARFQLVAAMNPCRCGYVADAGRACSRAPKCALDYQAKLSGPLLDRIDIHVEVPEVPVSDMFDTREGESSASVARRVATARQRQTERYASMNAPGLINCRADGDVLTQVASPDSEGMALLRQAAERLGLSMRGANRVLRVARTIADLENKKIIGRQHVAEALSFRQLTVGR